MRNAFNVPLIAIAELIKKSSEYRAIETLLKGVGATLLPKLGFEDSCQRLRSLLLGAYRNSRPYYFGHSGSGFSEKGIGFAAYLGAVPLNR